MDKPAWSDAESILDPRASVGDRALNKTLADPAARLKILHVVDSLEYGGLEGFVTDLALAQTAAGNLVSVFSINDTDGHRKTLEANGIPVIQGGKSRTLDPAVLRALRNASLHRQVDIVHAHNFVPNYYAAASLLFAKPKPALVTTCHDMGSRLSNRKLRLLFRWSLRRTTRIAMVGESVYGRFVGTGMVDAARAALIMNGIPTQRFHGGSGARKAARAALSLPADRLVIGSVGRLVPLKNHQSLIDLMPSLLRTFPHLILAIVGEGELRRELEARAASIGVTDYIHFAGERRDVAAVLHAFDIFTLPSLTEGLSIALLEASAAGLPIVASNTGGNPEIVKNDVTGLLFSLEDSGSLETALVTLLGDSALRQRLGVAAREWVQAHGSLSAAYAAYQEFYHVALRDRGHGRQ